jgi:hypothetical protein
MNAIIIQFPKRRPRVRVKCLYGNIWSVIDEEKDHMWLGFLSYEEALATAREIAAGILVADVENA